METTLDASPSKQRLRLWLRLLRASRMIENDMRELLRREFGTTLPRFDVMAALHRAGKDGLTMGELSRQLMVSGGNVTHIVDRLEDDGLVYRIRKDKDRRSAVVELSGEGRALFEQMAGAHEIWISRRLAGLSGDDTAEAIRLLKDIDTSVEKARQ